MEEISVLPIRSLPLCGSVFYNEPVETSIDRENIMSLYFDDHSWDVDSDGVALPLALRRVRHVMSKWLQKEFNVHILTYHYCGSTILDDFQKFDSELC